MIDKGAYLWYRRIKRKSPGGQIAAVLTIIIAIIFLFIAITINIGKVSQAKTAVSIAADSAALACASGLASFGHYISEDQLDGYPDNCDINWRGILGVGLIIVSFFCGPFQSGVFTLGASQLFNANVLEFPVAVASANRNMAKLTATNALHEIAIQQALFATVDDPEIVQDVNDYDEDDRTDDKISRFSAWYAWRTYMLDKETEALRTVVSQLRGDLFGFYLDSKNMRRYISGPNNWPAPAIGGFMKLLEDVEEDHADHIYSTEERGVVYDFIPGTSWSLYQTSQNVADLQLLAREDRTLADNLYYDFSFYNAGVNPNDQSDSVNDEVDFFLKDLQSFRELLYNIFGDLSCSIDWEDEALPTECEDALVSIDGLISSIENWYPTLKDVIETTLSDWTKDGGPLERWHEELLNRGSGSLLNKFDSTIQDLEDQIKNDKGLYSGGLQTILEQGAAKLTEDEKTHLNDMISKMQDSILVLEKISREEYSSQNPKANLKNVYYAGYMVQKFRDAYAQFRVKWDRFKENYAAFKTPEFGEYTWQDSTGQHKVRVDVSINPTGPRDLETKVPTIHWHTAWLGFSKCGNLRNYRGSVDITVTRTDIQEKEVNLAQRLLWIFKSPAIRSKARASYDAMSADSIRIVN